MVMSVNVVRVGGVNVKYIKIFEFSRMFTFKTPIMIGDFFRT